MPVAAVDQRAGAAKTAETLGGTAAVASGGDYELPAPTGDNSNGRPLKSGPKVWPPERPLNDNAGALTGLRLAPVTEKATSQLWNGRLIDRCHYRRLHAVAGGAGALPDRVGPRVAGGAGFRSGGMEGVLSRPLDWLGAGGARNALGTCGEQREISPAAVGPSEKFGIFSMGAFGKAGTRGL